MQIGRTGDGMGRTRGRRRLVAVVGGASALAALAWLVAAFDGQGTATPSAGYSGALVLVPLALLLAIAGVTWFLLAKDAHAVSDPEPCTECGSCGRSILREWRLCPYCGSRVSVSPVTDDGLAARRDPAASNGYDVLTTGPGSLTHTRG
jgi:ribosomal protein L32